MKSVFLKLEKEKKKRPKVFEEGGREGGSFDKSRARSLPQNTTTKKVSGVRQISLYALSLSIYLSHDVPPSLSSIQHWSPLHPDSISSVFWREVERGGAAMERRVEGDGGVISSVYGVVSQEAS